jgi:hypothetical protein
VLCLIFHFRSEGLRLAYWKPEAEGFWPIRRNVFRATDAATGQVIHEDKRQKAHDGNQQFVDYMLARVKEQGYYFTPETLKAMQSEYRLDFKSMAKYIEDAAQLAKDLKSDKKN